jgi:hypothetical protein
VTPDDRAKGPYGLGPHYPQVILGEVALQGASIYLGVPADAAFRIQFLDKNFMAVGGQINRWFNVAPGETFPAGAPPGLYQTLCAGCHGAISGRREEMPSAVPDIITAASITLASHEHKNPRRKRDPQAAYGWNGTVDFQKDIGPLVARSCAGCHGGGSPAGGLDLTSRPGEPFDLAYLALLADGPGSGGGRRYVDDINSSARTSHLIERILGRELDAPKALEGTGACVGQPVLSDEERALFARWIDLGGLYRSGP